jgi:hypothetical protein
MLDGIIREVVDRYVADLRKELVVCNIKGEKLEAILAETETHLREAMEAAKPQSLKEMQKVLDEFGPAARMAEKLAAEYVRETSKRRYLWPAGIVVLYVAVFLSHVFDGTYRPFTSVSVSTLVIVAFGVSLFFAGFWARKPLVGQFAATAGALSLCFIAWFVATSYPFRYGPADSSEWYQTVQRGEVDKEVAFINGLIAHEGEVARREKLGKEVFSTANRAHAVPAAFIFRGRYWLPEGIQEITVGLPEEKVSVYCSTESWKEAVQAWNGKQPGHAENEADWNIAMAGVQTRRLQDGIDNLRWMQTQPLAVQIAADARVMTLPLLMLSGMALVITNGGWVAWLLVRAAGRAVRRKLYGSRPLVAR